MCKMYAWSKGDEIVLDDIINGTVELFESIDEAKADAEDNCECWGDGSDYFIEEVTLTCKAVSEGTTNHVILWRD